MTKSQRGKKILEAKKKTGKKSRRKIVPRNTEKIIDCLKDFGVSVGGLKLMSDMVKMKDLEILMDCQCNVKEESENTKSEDKDAKDVNMKSEVSETPQDEKRGCTLDDYATMDKQRVEREAIKFIK